MRSTKLYGSLAQIATVLLFFFLFLLFLFGEALDIHHWHRSICLSLNLLVSTKSAQLAVVEFLHSLELVDINSISLAVLSLLFEFVKAHQLALHFVTVTNVFHRFVQKFLASKRCLVHKLSLGISTLADIIILTVPYNFKLSWGLERKLMPI